MENNFIVHVTPNFEQSFRKLRKKYPKMNEDLRELLDEIEENGLLGDEIPGVLSSDNKIYKKRMKNTNAHKGKSGGFRVIHYLVTNSNDVFLLEIYSENQQEDISNDEIRHLTHSNQSYINNKLET